MRATMKAEDGAAHDQRRCRCHKVPAHKMRKLRDGMAGLGFELVFAEDYSRAFGMQFSLPEHAQMHVKVASNGWIEAEIEPPPEHSPARAGQMHVYSAHREVANMLDRCDIRPRITPDVPPSCLDSVVGRPGKPARWRVLVGALAAAARRFLAYWR